MKKKKRTFCCSNKGSRAILALCCSEKIFLTPKMAHWPNFLATGGGGGGGRRNKLFPKFFSEVVGHNPNSRANFFLPP